MLSNAFCHLHANERLGIIHGVQVLWSLFQTSLFVRRETLCRLSQLAHWLVSWFYCSISELARLPQQDDVCLSLTPGVSSFPFLFSFLF
jgi:hypothetical protein